MNLFFFVMAKSLLLAFVVFFSLWSKHLFLCQEVPLISLILTGFCVNFGGLYLFIFNR